MLEGVFQNGCDHFHADLKLLKAIRELLPDPPKVDWEFPPMEERGCTPFLMHAASPSVRCRLGMNALPHACRSSMTAISSWLNPV